jgi:NAD(P)-dependent dehydrogenase (short-subunit alcohol dehydrogenase family)
MIAAGKEGLKKMADKRVWFITGTSRGMGVDMAQAALAASHAVVATGRNTEAVADAIGEADDLLVVELDITSLASAETQYRPRSSASAESTCWSTTPATSMPATSRS